MMPNLAAAPRHISSMPRQMIVAFARYPLLGKVKTRLAAGTGNEQALELYKLLLKGTIYQMTRCTGVIAVVACADVSDCVRMRDWLAQSGLAVDCQVQLQSSDLGCRMTAALAHGFAEGASKVCVIGTDIPELSQPILDQALHLLDEYKVVLGPSQDGGFYLVGSSQPQPELMQDIQWSCSTTRAEVRRRARDLGVSIAPDNALPCLQDIDTLQDLRAWHASLDDSVNPEAHSLAGKLLSYLQLPHD